MIGRIGDVRVAFFGDLFRPPGAMTAQDPPFQVRQAALQPVAEILHRVVVDTQRHIEALRAGERDLRDAGRVQQYVFSVGQESAVEVILADDSAPRSETAPGRSGRIGEPRASQR